ncbi:MAG: GNAT family N-acetyltransferase [Alphaproteobacteria bacterium]|nr:GNAT family N-acetyltransferase [Alphaproteobacteria bacterium]
MTLLETCGGAALRIRGAKVWLRPLSPEDIGPRYLKWLNDPEINEFTSRHNLSFVKKDLFAYLDSANASTDRLLLGIFTNDKNIHIGNVLLHIIDAEAGIADLSNLIGERAYWGRGIIADADSQAIHFGFQALGLTKFVMGNIAPHRASTFKSTSLGAQLEAKFRSQAIFQGKRVDILRFGVFPSEFYDAHPELRETIAWVPDIASQSSNAEPS